MIHCRTCGSGRAPRNPSTSWPPITATTIGIDCTWSAAASCGLASTSTLASNQSPAASLASRSSTGPSCLQGSHHSAHRSTITGADCDLATTSVLNVASVTSKTKLDAAPAAPPCDACSRRFAAACLAPRSTAPAIEKSRGCCITPSCRTRCAFRHVTRCCGVRTRRLTRSRPVYEAGVYESDIHCELR